MKKRFIFYAVAALALTACGSDDATGVSDGNVAAQVSAGVDVPLSRALNDQWEADEIGVMVIDAPTSDMESMYLNAKYSTTATTSAAANFTSSNGIYFQDASETVTFAAYGPYQTSSANEVLPGTDGVISGISTESQSTRDSQKAFDFIYASGATARKSSPAVNFTGDYAFTHKMTRLVIIVKPGDDMDAEDIIGGDYTLDGLVHEGTFDVTTGVATADETATATTGWSLTENSLLTEGETEQVTYTSILYPQALGSALTFTATIDRQQYINNTAINPASMLAGKSYTYTMTVKKTGLTISGCTVEDWGSGDEGEGEAMMPDKN